ncbi:hypothetical protein AMTRI_Chr02g211720 [Amborella trichopoda]
MGMGHFFALRLCFCEPCLVLGNCDWSVFCKPCLDFFFLNALFYFFFTFYFFGQGL